LYKVDWEKRVEEMLAIEEKIRKEIENEVLLMI